MTYENKCSLSHLCKKSGVEGYCDSSCYVWVRLHGESGKGGLIGASGIPKAYLKSRVDNLPFKDSNVVAFKTITRYADGLVNNLDKGIGLYLFGTPSVSNPKGCGNGKTTAVTALLNEYILKRVVMEAKKLRPISEIPALFIKASTFQNSFNAQFRGDRELQDIASEEYYRVKNLLKTVDMLVLDDIGLRSTTEAFKSEFYEVIDQRDTEMLGTIFTANVPISEISNILDERISSRIEGMTTPIPFGGKDFRRKDF